MKDKIVAYGIWLSILYGFTLIGGHFPVGFWLFPIAIYIVCGLVEGALNFIIKLL